MKQSGEIDGLIIFQIHIRMGTFVQNHCYGNIMKTATGLPLIIPQTLAELVMCQVNNTYIMMPESRVWSSDL